MPFFSFLVRDAFYYKFHLAFQVFIVKYVYIYACQSLQKQFANMCCQIVRKKKHSHVMQISLNCTSVDIGRVMFF